MLNVTIDTDNGWLHAQPKATQDFIQRKLLKAQAEGNLTIGFKGEHDSTSVRMSALTVMADMLGRSLAEDFKTVPPYFGVTR